MDYKTINALLGDRGAGLTDYDGMVSDRRAKTQADLAGLDEMQSLIDYTTPPQLRAAKMQDIEGRRAAIGAERSQLETDEDFLRRYATSHLEGTSSPAPTAERSMEPYIAPTAKDMIRQPVLSDQSFNPDAPLQNTDSFELDPFDPTMGAGRSILEPIKEFAIGVPRGGANMLASAPAMTGTLEASSNREAVAFLDQSETLLRRMAELKQSGADEFEIVTQAGELLNGTPAAIKYKVSQAIGDINAGDDPDTVIAKYREAMLNLPLETKDTGGYKLAQTMHKKINETLPTAEGYEDAWSTKLGEGTGSLLPVIGASILAGPAGGIGIGMAGQGGGAVEEAVGDKASEDDTLKYGLAGTVIGSLEALPVGKLLGTGAGIVGRSLGILEKAAPSTMGKVSSLVAKLSPAAQTKFAKAAGEIVGQGVEEGTQEGLSQTLLNVAGQLTYDEKRDTFEGVPEAVALGAIIGGGVKGVQLGLGAGVDETAPSTDTSLPPSSSNAGNAGGPDKPQGGLDGELSRGEPDLADPISGTFDPFTIDGERVTGEVSRTKEPATGLGGLEGEIMEKDRAPTRAEPVRGSLESPIVEGEVNRNLLDEPLPELPGSTPDYQVIDDGLDKLTDYVRKSKPSAPLRIEKKEDLQTVGEDVKEPTEAQKEAGNYRKGHMKVDGLDVTIETPKGTERKGVDPTGKEWSVEMPGHYGYIKRSTGMDGDHVDVTVGDDVDSKKVFVVDQVNADTKAPDEHKVIMGVPTAEAAADLYQRQFSDGRGAERMGAMVELDSDAFKGWLKNGDTKAPIASQMPDAVIKATETKQDPGKAPQQREKTPAPVSTEPTKAETAPAANVEDPDHLRTTRMMMPRDVSIEQDPAKPNKWSVKFGDKPIYEIDTPQLTNKQIDAMVKVADESAIATVNKTGDKTYIVKTADGSGDLGLADRGKFLKVGIASVSKEKQGKGRGVALYEEALRFAGEQGKTLRSDMSVSGKAVRVYDALKRRGYKVTQNPDIDIVKAKDGGMVGPSGSWVFEVEPKESENVKSGTAGVQPGIRQPGSDGQTSGARNTQPRPAESGIRTSAADNQQGPRRGVESRSERANDARQRNRARLSEHVRRFAEKEGDSEKLTLTHFGRKFHNVLKPQDGWATNGAEKARAGHKDFQPRTYYGIGTGEKGGYTKEVAGKFGHKTSIDPAELYDAAADPDNLDAGKGLTQYEKAIKDAGFAGYVTKVGTKGQQGPAAVVFYDAEVEEHFDDGIKDEKHTPRASGLEKTVRLGDSKKRLYVGPVEIARKAKQEYARRSHIRPATTIREYVKVDEARAKRIANAFEEMEHKPNDPLVRAAYDAMIRETLDQYQSMLDAGFKPELIKKGMKDPYAASPRLAIEDIRDNNHMWIFPTDEGFGSSDLDVSDNPLLAETEYKDINGRTMLANDVFRAVHDYFGHAVEGNGMRARGEEMAWRVHASMYSPLARRAMTTETRGQNSWVNYGPSGETNKTASGSETVFAPQKIGLLPEWVSDEGLHDPTHLKNIERSKQMAKGRRRGPQTDKVKKPASIIEFIARNGGIREQTGELKAIGLTNATTGFVPGAGQVVRPTGGNPDRVREMVTEAGYLREGSTIADLYNALDEDARSGREFFSQQDDEIAARWREAANDDDADMPFFGADEKRYGSDPDKDLYKLAPGFYSNITKGIENAKQKAAPAKDWKSIIAALPGARKAEIDWIGVNQWLDEQTGQVTRDDLVNFVKANEIEVHETVLTNNGFQSTWDDERFAVEIGDTEEMDPDDDWIDQIADDYMDEARDRMSVRQDEDGDVDEDEVREMARQIALEGYEPEQRGDITINYGDGSSAGYIFTHSDGQYWFEGDTYNSYDQMRDAVNELAAAEADQRGIDAADMDYGTSYEGYVEPGGRNYREILLTIPGLEEKGTNATFDRAYTNKDAYESSHFEKTPNIIVHARVNDRRNGEVLFIEEVQSDLGSDLRKSGTPPIDADFARWDKLEADYQEAHSKQLDAEIALQDKFEAEFADKVKEAIAKGRETNDNGALYRFSNDVKKGLGNYWAEHIGNKDPDDNMSFIQMPYSASLRDGDLKEAAQYARWLNENAADELKAVVDTARIRDDAKLRISEMSDPNNYRPSSLPNFPFEGESYYHLAMKRLLRLAVDEGKKAIAWTPAYMQARRWSQAVQNMVKNITWFETYDTGREVTLMGVNGIDVIKVDQNGVMQSARGGKISTDDVEGKKLSDLLSKSVADQIMGVREGALKDQQIVIGGDGYVIAYDRNMKGFMEKFAKRYGSSVTVDKGVVGFDERDAGKLMSAYILDPQTKVSDVFDHVITNPNVNPEEFRKAVDTEMERLKGKADDALSEAERHLRDMRREFSEFVEKHGEGDMMESKLLDDIKAQEDAVKATEITAYEFSSKRGPSYNRYEKRVIINSLRSVITEKGALDHMRSKIELTGDPVWKVEITDKMRDAILEGQPFSIGRDEYQITPEAQNKIDDLLAVIRKVAPGLKVRMDVSIDGNKNIWGKYSRDNGAITIASIALAADRGKHVFGHEALHAFVDHGLLTPQEIQILQAYSEKNDLIGKYGLRESYEKMYGPRGLDPADYQRMINEEGIAELVGEMIGTPETQIPGDLKGIIGKLKRTLERIANALRGLGFQTSSDILKKIRSGEVGRRQENFIPGGDTGVVYSLGHDRVASIKRTTANDLGDFLATDSVAIRKARAAQRYLQDKFLSVKLMQRALDDNIADSENAYLAEELSAARIPEQTQEMNDKMQDVLEELHEQGIPRDLFERFLRMRHAKERNENIAKINTKFKDGGSGTRTKVAERWLRQAAKLIPADKMTALKDAASKIYALNREALDVRLEGGLIDQDYYDELTKQYKYYVPLKGHEFMDDLKPMGNNRGYGAKGSGLKQAMGRRSEAQNTLSYVVEDFRRAIYSAERNKVNIALFNFIKNNQKLKADGTNLKDDFFELDPIKYKRILVKKRGIYQGRKIWIPADFVGDDAKIASYLAGLEGNASERQRLDPTPAHNDLPVMIGGKRHIMRIKNDTLLNDLLDMHTNIERIPFFGAAMSGFTRLLTMWNPAFGPTNFVRDVLGVGLTTGSELGAKEAAKVMKTAFTMTRVILNSVRNKTPSDPNQRRLLDLYKEMKLSGGSTGFSHVVRDAETIQRELEQEAQWLTGNRSVISTMKHGVVTLDRFMEKFNRVFEDSTRLAAFENRLDAGWSKEQALSYAKNVTVNFNKRGYQTGFSQWYAFANANFQGNYRMLRAFINGKNGAKVLGGLIGGGFLYGLANILLGYDDDEPEKINSWYEKNQFDKAFYIILGPIKLPKPHGFMIPFDIGTKMAELMMAAIDPEHCNPARRSNADMAASALAEVGAGLTSFVPIGTQEDTILRFFPTLVAPLGSAALNMSPFGGSLYPEGFDKTQPNWKQFYAETPEIYHKTAQWMNTLSGGNDFESGYVDVSPEVVEFLVNSYLGGAGGELRKASSLAMTGVDAALGNETKPIRIEDVPIIRRFFPSQRTNSLTDYYFQFNDRMQTVKNAMKEAKGGSESAREFLKEHKVERELMGEWDAAKKQRKSVRGKIEGLDEERLQGNSTGLRRDILINKRSLIERRFARTFQIDDQIEELKQGEQNAATHQAIQKLLRDKAVMKGNIAKLIADQDQLLKNSPSDKGRISTLGKMFK